ESIVAVASVPWTAPRVVVIPVRLVAIFPFNVQPLDVARQVLRTFDRVVVFEEQSPAFRPPAVDHSLKSNGSTADDPDRGAFLVQRLPLHHVGRLVVPLHGDAPRET